MPYPGAAAAAQSRELLGTALEALQKDPEVPEDVMTVASNIASAVGALFEAERASSEVDGKASIKHAMGSLSQTMALLQDVGTDHSGVSVATEKLAEVMGKLYPLASAPSVRPSRPSEAPRTSIPGTREQLEANVGATTESNFFVGFSGDISEGGVFVATYLTLPLDAKVDVLVTLPGGYESRIPGTVRFVRDPMDMDSEPGIGVAFDRLEAEARDLILRFIRKRPPLFFDT
ncbi:MAG: PilZ domain-containing protein [Myxococcales bacterium]|nr:PilZ domain-containing protein [Myxococcales bacterium]MDD9972242.1 PilZ domain-containing protein [Myxococcales bacterium]